ncbi:MAG: glycosyltransferase [Cyanobacteriota bacterium]|nr:glycosyltransferase [Cyanobacteriota bacterium]
MTPLISLVITSYNQSQYLKGAIATILAQTHLDFELIVWDDGSTDDSVQIARQYATTDERVTVVAAEHLGRGEALKAAINRTSGRYLGWVDGDDLLAATALEETAAILDTHPEVGVTYTDYAEIDRDGQFLSMGKRCKIPYSPHRLLTDFMMFHFRLMRRSAYDRVGGINPEFEYIEDYDLCLRLSEVTEVRHLQQPLYFYRLHGENTSRFQYQTQVQRSQKAIERALERRGLANTLKIEVKRGKFCLRRIQSQKRTVTPSRIASMLVPLSLPFIPMSAVARPLQPFNAYGIADSSSAVVPDGELGLNLAPDWGLDLGFDTPDGNPEVTIPLPGSNDDPHANLANPANPANPTVPNSFLNADDTEYLIGEGYGDEEGEGYTPRDGDGYGYGEEDNFGGSMRPMMGMTRIVQPPQAGEVRFASAENGEIYRPSIENPLESANNVNSDATEF